jgi:hypothetical protein
MKWKPPHGETPKPNTTKTMKAEERKKQMMAEVNQNIRESIAFWASTMLQSEADQWAYHLNYDTADLLNAVYILQHVASNIGIKNGTITEQNVEELGLRIHDLVLAMTGYDTRQLAADLQDDGHHIDDPANVADVKPDFSSIGMDPQ